MSKILIVYGTKYGQTEKIANYIASALDPAKHSVEMLDSAFIPQSLNPANYDAIIVGAPVYSNRYQKSLTKWVQKNAPLLNDKKTAFYSVCLGILQKDEQVRKQEWKLVNEFLSKNQWNPQMREIFPGSLAYSKYDLITKFVMRRISKKEGRDTDTSHDYEYTDWSEVLNFVNGFSDLLEAGPLRRQSITRETPSKVLSA